MSTTVDTEKMAKAFELVCPAAHAKKLAELGVISAETAAKVSWKDQIAALVLDTELDAAGLTMFDLADAVQFFTATSATITRQVIGKRAHDPVEFRGQSRPGFMVLAKGYRAGPAGDH